MDTLRTIAPFFVDAIVILGILVMTVGVYGLASMPDIYTKAHAASQAVVFGAIALVATSLATLESAFILRSALIIIILLITTPLSAHAIANAAILRGERMRTQGAINESPFELTRPDPSEIADTGSARLRALLGE